MAKSSRASTKKANNRRLVKNVFGPAEAARNERLSAKLLEVAKQPKPESSDVNMNTQEEEANESNEDAQEEETTMDVDSVKKPSSGRIEKKRPDKRKQQSCKITFKSYGSRSKGKGKKKSA
ncbi:hypothetical protein NXS19_003147 [Fusarium pseudograminearum]|uniref:DUF2423 domain-containing protein n=1 Tax=Fusarium pseudograminearum (strain CS3096) TaxID=1028729 RepID=K3VEM3_FUSPC|nr:hypothetical protein FPSE_08629 [Fusarium pseudograminearum CS3096]EKJ71123.1 hypothetical protein FPSE_08629 [Fusarium pseudograminearum CS3096]KAF0642607.1 hypothetical protein FPSE5266_08629 [Fusarium pseudograminearum]QPC76991.1 hypothetical protein HYE68_007743 [Fusarium pseudograminearum]UZP35331.1 hypothetical protein NXS19_003147 [Fusarium pseudograminearum]